MHPIVKQMQELYTTHTLCELRKENGNRTVWLKKLIDAFPGCFVEDMTDLNYSSSHEYWIWLPHGEEAQRNEFFALHVLISLLGPYAMVKYLRRYDKVELDGSSTPFRQEDEVYGQWAARFLERNGLVHLDDDTLQLIVPGVTLELQEDEVSVYNCVFEDTSSFFPYKGL